MRKALAVVTALVSLCLSSMPALAAKSASVIFESHGQKIAGRLYWPDNYEKDKPLPGVVVVPPWLNVKEQVAERYAETLANRGLTALAFDFRYWGQSGGQPREWESPSAKIEDIKAAADFLSHQQQVDPDRVGVLGICFGAGYALAAASEDPRIKSVATVAAWLHNKTSLEKMFGKDEIARRYQVGHEAQAHYDRNHQADYVPAASQTDKTAGMYNQNPDYFYNTETRGVIPAWTNKMAVMSWPEWLDFDAADWGSRINKPLLIVHSDHSALPDNARRVYNEAKGFKALYWTQGAHTDFYDHPAQVREASDIVASHFHRTLGYQQ